MTVKELEELINSTAEKYFSIKNNPHEKEKLAADLFSLFTKYPQKQYPKSSKINEFQNAFFDTVTDVFKHYILDEEYDPGKGKISFLLTKSLSNTRKKIIQKNKKEEIIIQKSKQKLKEEMQENKDKFFSERDDVTPDIINAFLKSTDVGMEFFTHTKTSKERSNSDTEWVKQILTHTWHPGLFSYEDKELTCYKFVCLQLLNEIISFRKETHKKKYSQQMLADKCGREKSSYNKTRERYAQSCIKHGDLNKDIVLFTLGNTLMKFRKPEEFCKQIAYRKI